MSSLSNKEIKELPVLDEGSFEAFTEKYTTGGYRPVFRGIKKPKNSAEFREITKRLYGVELDVACYVYPPGAFGEKNELSANYKIVYEGGQNEYCKKGIYPLWDKKYSQYDGLKVLLDWCFGELSCGGVAHVHYGQTKVKTKSDYNRIKKWGNQESNYLKARIDQHNSLVEIFGHNPFD